MEDALSTIRLPRAIRLPSGNQCRSTLRHSVPTRRLDCGADSQPTYVKSVQQQQTPP
jgi:hypothetical protein